jgi:hypothetical protein
LQNDEETKTEIFHIAAARNCLQEREGREMEKALGLPMLSCWNMKDQLRR